LLYEKAKKNDAGPAAVWKLSVGENREANNVLSARIVLSFLHPPIPEYQNQTDLSGSDFG
jgi:hypothetical protein